MNSIIWCCRGCVAPKRYPGCHAKCPEYLAQKAEYDKKKASDDLQRDISININNARSEKVYKALRDRRSFKSKQGKG